MRRWTSLRMLLALATAVLLNLATVVLASADGTCPNPF